MVTGRGVLRPWDPIFARETNYGALNEVVGNTPPGSFTPIFVGIGTRSNGNVVAVPASLAAGDLMLACLQGNTGMNPTNPGGWTELYNQDNPGGYNRDLAAFIKFAVGGETTFNFSASGEGQIYTFRNIDTTTPLDVAIAQGTSYSGAGFTAETITTATAGALLFAYDESRIFDTTYTFTTANGYTKAVEDFVAAAVRIAETAGTYVGWSTGDIGSVQRGTTIAFRRA